MLPASELRPKDTNLSRRKKERRTKQIDFGSLVDYEGGAYLNNLLGMAFEGLKVTTMTVLLFQPAGPAVQFSRSNVKDEREECMVVDSW